MPSNQVPEYQAMYLIFAKEVGPVVQSQYPNINKVMFNKILGGIWRRLDHPQLEEYHNKALMVFKQGGTIEVPPYIQPFNTNLAHNKVQSKTQRKHTSKQETDSSYKITKLAEDRRAYSYFAQEVQGLVTALYPEMKMQDVAKVLTKMWTKCSEVEKSKYYEIVNKDSAISATCGEGTERHHYDKTENFLCREESTIPSDGSFATLEMCDTVDDISTEDIEAPPLAIKIVSVVSLRAEFQEDVETEKDAADNIDDFDKKEEADQSENDSIQIVVNDDIHQVEDTLNFDEENVGNDFTAKSSREDFNNAPKDQQEIIEKNMGQDDSSIKMNENPVDMKANTKEELRNLIGALVLKKDHA